MKWAFTRFRPSPQGDHVDVAPIAASESPVIAADTADTATAPDNISTQALCSDAEIAVAPPAAETAISAIAESPTAAPTAVDASDVSLQETAAEAAPVVVEDVALAAVEVESEPLEAGEPVVYDNPPTELAENVEPVALDEPSVSSVEIEIVADEAPVLTADDDTSCDVLADVELEALEDPCGAPVDGEVPDVSEVSISSAAVAVEIEPVPADDPAPVAAVAAEACSAETQGVVAEITPEPVLPSPAQKIAAKPKARAKVVEPADRTALIRQRWAETGIRMWNPRLHGTGDATLNIQGRIGLLPPAPGETMPRYDKLEFTMLGGQIVCEGVIVEAPAHASQRSFTRLADPVKSTREPVRERQAVLA
ncbi:hypothetical protein [Bradyrhizobium sp. BR 10289]|uniref:hypothetical protein n=1 Tax=Bradyrhizobium sp. BR 10289 TaxID=2749993 RepID=UPI0032DFBB9D